MIIALDNLENRGDYLDYCYKDDENLYYINEKTEKRKSIEELLTKGKYTYGMPQKEELLKKYNNNLKNYKIDKKLDCSDFEKNLGKKICFKFYIIKILV